MQIITIPFFFANWREHNYCYLLHDEGSNVTIAFDPAGVEEVQAELKKQGWKLTHILNTHQHHDHIDGNFELQKLTGCEIVKIPQKKFKIGGISIKPMHFSGHSQHDICFYIEEDNILIVGDLLFEMSCGRCKNGDYKSLFNALEEIKKLPPETEIHTSHNYGAMGGAFALSVEPDSQSLRKRNKIIEQNNANNIPNAITSLEDELATNPFLRTNSPEIRKKLGLENPSNVEVFTKLRQLRDRF